MSDPTAITAELLCDTPLPAVKEGSKESRGRTLVIAGSVETPGAALLAGTAALRAGAGKLQVATCESIAPHLAIALPEARVIGMEETAGGGVRRNSVSRLEHCVASCDAIVLGPGMVEEDDLAGFIGDVLQHSDGQAVVLDAAALAYLPRLGEALEPHDGRIVLTPHAGEMAGLLDIDRAEVEEDPLGAARLAGKQLHAVVVMKGASTHVVSPQGEAWRFDGGNVGLATSGSGDVLAGLLGGLLARGTTPLQAALWAVYLHGEAGARLAQTTGPLGFLAREIAAEAPRIMAELGG